jgi:putative endonuclease
MFYIYFLHSPSADKFYIGFSADPWKRLDQHNQNSIDSFTGKFADWSLVAVFQASTDRAYAMRCEAFIKKQKSRTFLLKMMCDDFTPFGVLHLLVRVPHVRD